MKNKYNTIFLINKLKLTLERDNSLKDFRQLKKKWHFKFE